MAGPGGAWDPTLTRNINWGHSANPSTNSINSGGVSVSTNDSQTRNFGIQQSFMTGGNLNLGFNNGWSKNNNPNTNFFPSISSGLSLQGTQPLLQGFGLAFNTRNIRIAKNNLKLTDYQFQQSLNTTLNTVIQQYWNLVGARMSVDVAQSTLELNQTHSTTIIRRLTSAPRRRWTLSPPNKAFLAARPAWSGPKAHSRNRR